MSRAPRYSDQKRAAIVKAYESGQTLRVIAEMFNSSEWMVNSIVRQGGCSRRRDRKAYLHRKLRPDRIEAARLFKSGKTYGQIARDLGITRNAVASAVRDVRMANSSA